MKLFAYVLSILLIVFSVKAAAGDDRCSLPSDAGICRAMVPRYFYDAKTGECLNFIYGGCRGNENNFGTKSECEKACIKA